MRFGEALDEVTRGKRVGRKSWPSDMWLFYVLGGKVVVGADWSVRLPGLGKVAPFLVGLVVECSPHVDIYHAGRITPYVVTTQDLLATDWEIR